MYTENVLKLMCEDEHGIEGGHSKSGVRFLVMHKTGVCRLKMTIQCLVQYIN